MFRWILLCAITAMSGVITQQVWAQAANPEPGYCAQFYPNADCNSVGPATPGAARPAPEAEQRTWADFCQMLLASNAFLYVE